MVKRGYRRKAHKKGKKAKGKSLVTKDYLKKTIGAVVELKYKDYGVTTAFDGNNAAAAGPSHYYCLTGMVQGITDSDRVGDRIYLRSLQLRGFVIFDKAAANGNVDICFRLVVFQFHPVVADAGTLTSMSTNLPISTILNFGSNTGGTLYGPDSFMNHDRRQTYTVLYNKLYSGYNQSTNYANIIKMDLNIPLRKARKHIDFISGSSTSADNHLCYFLISNVPSGQANPPTLQGVWRLNYIDA